MLKKGSNVIIYIISLYLLSWSLKIIFGFYHIPSESMAPTLEKDDWIFVSKFPFVFRSPEYYPLTKINFPYWHSGTIINPKNDDLITFVYPISKQKHPSERSTLIKRCIGLPNDTLYILPSGDIITKTGIYRPKTMSDGGYSKVKSIQIFSEQDTINLSSLSIQKLKDHKFLSTKWNIVGIKANYLSFTIDNISMIVIPKKGMNINLLNSNASRWTELIRRDINIYDEKETSENKIDSIITNGNYSFTQNFYFFIGDNMFNSDDSRKWQSVPEKLIIGKVLFRFRWNPLKLNRFKWLG